MAVNKVPPRKPPVVCPPAAADDAEVREDTVMALEGLFSKDKNIVEYSEEDYVAKTRELLTRKGFVVPTDSKIRGDIGWFRCHQGDLSSRLTHWIREMPLAASDPIAVIRSVATDVSCCHVFMSYSFSNSFGQRIVGGYDPSYLPSPTTEAIINNAEEGVAAAHLIVGASGSGKTMSLVGFGETKRQRAVFPVLFQPRDFGEMLLDRREGADGGLTNDMADLEPNARNARFLGALVRLAEGIIPGPALAALRRPAKADVTIVLAMDDASMSPLMVRAMMSLVPSAVREKLQFGEYVSLRLVASSTGVDGSEEFWGSETAAFAVHYIGDSHGDVNESIFFSRFLDSSQKRNALLFDVAPVMPIVRSNGRMAAVLGHLVVKHISPLRSAGCAAFDPRALLPPAAGMFASLNALRDVGPELITQVMVGALRQHIFPFLPVGQNNQYLVQTRLGLVTDVGRSHVAPASVSAYTSKGFLPISASFSPASEDEDVAGAPACVKFVVAPATGRYHLPLFATAMLASLSGMAALARNINTSDTLGQHWLGASFLAACAAASPGLFELLLDEGRLQPLGTYVGSHRRVAKIQSALLAGGCLPDAASVVRPVPSGIALRGGGGPMVVLLCDLPAERVCIADSLEEGTAAHSVYVGIVEGRLKAAAAQLDDTTTYTARVAAFRSPTTFPFADSILFLNDSLYLFCVTEVAQVDGEEGGAKCAWTKGAFEAAYKALHNGPLEGGLRAAWKATMGIDIRHVRYCFVSNGDHDFAEDLLSDRALSTIQKQCKFVVADANAFLPYKSPKVERSCIVQHYLPSDEKSSEDSEDVNV